jgi:multidrug efflux system membrane fusion protein
VSSDRVRQLTRAGLLALVVAVATGLALHSTGRGREVGDTGDQPLPTPVRVKVIDGRTHVVVTPEDMAAGGIEVTAPKATTYQERVSGLGTVIAPQTLAEQAHAYEAAVAEATRAALAVKAARLEVERLAPLHRADRIVSDKALESAQDDLVAKEANVKAANAQLETQRAVAKERWGPVIARWLAERAPPLSGVLAGRELLVRIALPAGPLVSGPTGAHLQAAPGVALEARILSGVPQADPVFQGQSFYALTAEEARLRPGMTVPATVSLAAPVAGVVVPDSAVVRWRGEPWVFVESTKGQFVRQAISTEIATPDGWLVSSGLSASTPIVVRGAQLLLSEEVKAQSAGDAR